MESQAKLTIRLPVSLHRRLVELAGRERRSLNSQIVVLLEWASAEAEHQSRRNPTEQEPPVLGRIEQDRKI